ncbi:MAG: MaoC family dehydratase [Syntrophales bacterium]|nr:MaoC family dehydratase [Syntrophales bacterium]
MTPFYFEDFHVGDRFTSPGVTMTESLIIDFALQFDPQAFHTDVESAKSSLYGGLIASGIHTMAVTFRLFLSTGILSNNLGSPGFDELRWLLPVRPGDTVHSTGEVLEIHPSRSHPDRGMVRFKIATVNQRDEIVQTILCTLMIRRHT